MNGNVEEWREKGRIGQEIVSRLLLICVSESGMFSSLLFCSFFLLLTCHSSLLSILQLCHFYSLLSLLFSHSFSLVSTAVESASLLPFHFPSPACVLSLYRWPEHPFMSSTLQLFLMSSNVPFTSPLSFSW